MTIDCYVPLHLVCRSPTRSGLGLQARIWHFNTDLKCYVKLKCSFAVLIGMCAGTPRLKRRRYASWHKFIMLRAQIPVARMYQTLHALFKRSWEVLGPIGSLIFWL